MKSIYIAIGTVLLNPCVHANTLVQTASEAVEEATVTTLAGVNLPDATIDFLWWDRTYDAIMDDTVYTIFLNYDYLKSMTDQEKAAMGYIATFIGSECWWDEDDPNDDRSNLDCKVINALGLGYQCSQTHLGFLRKWFSTEKDILSQLEQSNCPTTPYTANSQNTFDKIVVKTKGDAITVYYEANGVNMSAQESWKWSETVYFSATSDNVQLVKREKSEVVRERF